MKNVFFVLLALILTLGAAGCSSDRPPDAAAPPAEPAASPAPADAAPTPAAPAATAPRASKPAAEAPPRPAAPRTFEVPEGTELTVALINPISTARNKA